jgi:8-amino-7-oxononanoate synthase
MHVPRPFGAEESASRTAVERASIFDKCLRFTQADDIKALGAYPYFRLIETGQDTEVVVDGRKMLMLGSNSYLALTTHPKVKERAIEAIRRYGTGCAGSRFLNGTLPIHLELERRLAALVGKEAALVFSTGYQTNTGVISCLVQGGEYILSDKLNHACIVDGAQLSPGTMIRYNHNDMRDLERRLAGLPVSAGKLIVSDGVFSMEGDICELPRMVRLAHKYGAQVMLDDAHAIGVLGPGGAGTAAHFDVPDHVDLIMGTFSKSLAAIGGFIASSERVINYLKHHSRPFIFSASPAPASVAAVLAALDIGFDTGASQTPVIPIVVGNLERCFKVWRWLHDQNIFINPVVPPAVPPGRTLVRLSLTAGHTRQQLSWALDKLAEVGRKFGLLG